MPQTEETERESRILGGFVRFEAMKQSVNHVFYEAFERFEALKQSVNHVFCESLSSSKHQNAA